MVYPELKSRILRGNTLAFFLLPITTTYVSIIEGAHIASFEVIC